MALALLYGLVGLWVGVLLNWLIDLLPAGEAARPFSRCPSCGARPAVLDWVPLLGYLVRRGRCVSCGARLPVRAPLLEVTTSILFALLWHALGLSGLLPLYTFYLVILEIIFVIDLERRLVLNRLIWPAIAFALLTTPVRAWLETRSPGSSALALSPLGLGQVLSPWVSGMLSLLAGGAIGFIVYLVMWLITPRGLGAGDVKLALFVGLIVGLPGILWVIVGSSLLAGAAAAVLLLTRRVGMKSAIPFAPFMVLVAMVVLLYGQAFLR